MPNRLARETSPYLLQHAHNPVDWYPWGEEALERARRERKPILLSIGYAACHWCHVMEHESFEDEATARLMNERFVSIKVDREERPDLDGIYMQAVQAMTGHGGWPMTVFLTPEGEPFYGGTYFPREDRHGMPSFTRILMAVSETWEQRQDDVQRGAAALRELYASSAEPTRSSGPLGRPLLERAQSAIALRYDARHGGFQGAPRFPQVMALDFLLRASRGSGPGLDIALQSFRAMARGGIYDQIGGGFARYSVDAEWIVPHFEKMLYDNALLVRLGTHLWQATKDDEVRRVTEETIAWVARELTSPAGGFYSSLDADSEGHEGTYYVWDASELDALLGEDASIVGAHYGVTPAGNFEGKSILRVVRTPQQVATQLGLEHARVERAIARARRVLGEARSQRVPPGRDDKILASWNGLMLRGLAETARAFGGDEYRDLAVRSGEFLFRELVRDGRALRTHKDGESRLAGYLEDHAALGLGALALYELTFDRAWLDRARAMADAAVRWFWDDDVGAFFDTASDHEALITRPRDPTDNATPSGTSLATELLARLADLLNDVDMRRRATYVVETLGETLVRYPMAFGHMLGVADLLVNGAVEVALVGDPRAADFQALLEPLGRTYLPTLVLAGGAPDGADGVALLESRPMQGGRATAYVCRNYACEEPAVEADRLGLQLSAISYQLSAAVDS